MGPSAITSRAGAAGLVAANRLSGSDVTLSGAVIDDDGGKNGIRPFIRDILEWMSYAGILMGSALSALLVVNETGEKLYIWCDERSPPMHRTARTSFLFVPIEAAPGGPLPGTAAQCRL